VGLEGLGQFTSPMVRDLPPCNIVPQPTTVQRVPHSLLILNNNHHLMSIDNNLLFSQNTPKTTSDPYAKFLSQIMCEIETFNKEFQQLYEWNEILRMDGNKFMGGWTNVSDDACSGRP
jgi:hypothetical protein